jgi:hypothetical protein
MGIINIYHDKKWTLQFLDALYNSIDLVQFVIQYIYSGYFKRIKRIGHIQTFPLFYTE